MRNTGKHIVYAPAELHTYTCTHRHMHTDTTFTDTHEHTHTVVSVILFISQLSKSLSFERFSFLLVKEIVTWKLFYLGYK